MLKIIFLLILFIPFANADDSEQEENVEEEIIALPTPPDKPLPSKKQIDSLIAKIAKRYKVERALVRAIVMAESAYNAHAVSPKGAIGLMQLMPATAADYGVNDPNDLFNSSINVNTGVRHLKRLIKKYKNDYGRVIPAYNAGEGTVDRTNNNVTYTETVNYTAATIRNYKRYGGKRKINSKPTVAKKLTKGNHFYHVDPVLLSSSMKNMPKPEYLDPRLSRRSMFMVLESPKKRKK
jgi:soluble lytic murein transglycosylase-like protein